MNDKPELLSPVGDQDSLYAAVQNGADAVYLGGETFNARNRADNFSLQELKSAIDYAHIRGVRVYVTVNTLYKNNEIRDVLQFIEEIYHHRVDGVIVQDLGAAKLINESFPDLELHASTQLTVHNLAGAKYLESLGFSRVVLARELSLSEIKEIIIGTDLEVETFIHGALCVCYSGQCLMSSLIGGRSGNRGRCAQPCRLPYSLVDLETEEVINQTLAQQHLLSPKDINTLEILPELIETGISSLKIEGRMKRPEYAALTTRVYRDYLDEYFLDQDNYQVSNQDQEKLSQLFNRGEFIPGYYKGKEDLDLISYQRPKNWGLKVGEVLDYNPQTEECKIKLDKELNEGDKIEIWREEERNISFVVSNINRLNDKQVVIRVKRSVLKGDPIYRITDQELLDNLAQSFHQPDTIKKIVINGQLTARLGSKMEFKLRDKDGFYVSSTVDFIPEEARNQPLTEEDFREQLSKLGNTPYQLEGLDLEIDSNLFIPISKLNELRRNAVDKLNQIRKEQFLTTSRSNDLTEESFQLQTAKGTEDNELTVYLQQTDYITDIAPLEVDRIYLDSKKVNIDKLDGIISQTDKYNTELFIRLPRIAREEEMKQIKVEIEKLEQTEIDGYLVPQLGVVELVKDTNKELIADFSLNTFNNYTTKLWQKEGYKGVVLSPELTLKEVKKLARYNEIEKEVIVYGHLPMMISEYCPVGYVTGGGEVGPRGCETNCRDNKYGLLDRKDMIAPIKTDPNSCRSIIYNSQPLYLIKHLNKITKTNCQNYRLDFTIESKEEVITIIKAYQSKIEKSNLNSNILSNLNQKMQKEGYTTGHFFRGVK
ncbi:U32 family peptidase [Halanaerocella petrolearia]